MKYSLSFVAITIATLLSACGGSDDSSTPPVTSGQFALGVSDNPADAEVVNVAFKQVVLKSSDNTFSFNVSDDGGLKQVDLLTVQGQEVETLVSGQSVPLGEYQMCIYMKNNETASTDSSYVQTVDGPLGLVTNSNGSCGGVGADEADTGRLFFNKAFTIAAGTNTFVAEFELAKGLQAPHGNKDYWTLKPTSVQLVNVSEVGGVEGGISQSVHDNCEAQAGGSDFAEAVYLYPGSTALANMADFRGEGVDYLESEVAPIASARVNSVLEDGVEVLEYEFGFVAAGTYSLGYTCLANNDDADAANGAEGDFPFVIYTDEQDVVVINEASTERDFEPKT
ncbi:DUF4382 domain-containing protein [Shewanella nanhaiensis]|uniref:DUF4382 domain-containing protein n=1 Tax=Shewanella nanhaiensis TaxID=2864872 RepID=A0ABS7DZU1_9GAMM|nr:DUF4382 domain-containing protein [Shewanella nanhaiensis]MBW8182931.1 DUF4382 domain-containing protein [Shewanella nanhaiensis]